MLQSNTVIRFAGVSAKIGTCTVVSVNVTLAEAKMCTFTLESTHFIFNKCPIYTDEGASAKFRTKSQETDYSEGSRIFPQNIIGNFFQDHCTQPAPPPVHFSFMFRAFFTITIQKYEKSINRALRCSIFDIGRLSFQSCPK
jgi:hypothetical protein